MEFAPIAEEFVYSLLAYSPALATQVGYHTHKGASLDSQLDDYSAGSIETQRKFFSEFRARMEKMGRDALSAEDRADYDIISDQIAVALLEFDTIQSYRHNPTIYVELIGNALFAPYVLEYAPKADRYRHIIGRLERIPALLDQARKNLVDAPDVWNAVAREENDGNIGLVDKTLRDGAPAELKDAYEKAATTALGVLRGFNDWLKSDLSKRTSDWRLGKQKYADKFRYVLAIGQSPEQLLKRAEAELESVRRDMYKLSSGKDAPADAAELNRVVAAKLAEIAKRHATPEKYFDDARRDLQETREFVRAKNLLALPARDNLQVIETPEFMRGIYAVGGFNPAPALEPKLGAFYWITPISKDWPKERIESKLREYNYYGLKLLTIHEAMPGHYVQFEYANDVQPPVRRLLRTVLGNGPYVEGWAVYATEMMLDEGYLNNDPNLRLTFQKQQLRMIANAILDVRMQTMGMTDEQAMDLMIRNTFQEKEEATAKLQRAKLSSCQLPTYYSGWLGWREIREARRKQGAGFKLNEFHERAMKEAAVPLPVLGRLLQ